MNELSKEFKVASTMDDLAAHGLWVYREDPENPYKFEKLAVPLPDKRFSFTGGFFGDRPEVRPII